MLHQPVDAGCIHSLVNPRHRHARPEEIAALLAFLASDEAPYITGQPIVIDGGETAGGLASR